MTDLIERMARAWWTNHTKGNALAVNWDELSPAQMDQLIGDMRAAWAVAAEPTQVMENAGSVTRYNCDGPCGDIWQAMHGAADD